MGTGRITKRAVEAVQTPPAGKRAYLWDDQLKGFGVMVTPTGARSYLVQYRIGGRGQPTRRYTIGKHGSPWTADKARERATDLLELVRKKVDPMDADRASLAAAVETKAEAERLAVASYVETFIRLHAERKKLRSVGDIRSVFRRDIVPHLGAKSLKALRRSEIQACLDLVGERSGSAANKAHKWLRKMLAFAVNRGDLAASPMEGMGPPHLEGRRQRVLRGPELVVVWQAAGDAGEPWASFLRLLLLLGQRLREVAEMRWEEVDLATATWIIPAGRTKNAREHLVPLPPQAVAILESVQPDKAQRKGVVFSTNGRSPISGFSKLKTRLDRLIQERVKQSGDLPLPLEPWVFHDLRRSVATGCQALGFPIEHTEAVLNHVSGKRGGLAAVYQLHEYRDEKTASLNAWARHVEALLSSDTKGRVVPIQAARA